MEIAGRDGVHGLTMFRLAERVDAAVGHRLHVLPVEGSLWSPSSSGRPSSGCTASYHLLRDRSEAVLDRWDDPAAAAVARLAVFGAFWIASVETFPQEAASCPRAHQRVRAGVPPEEHHRVLPAAMALLDEARRGGRGRRRAEGVLDAVADDDPMHVVIRWAAGSPVPSDLEPEPLNPLRSTGRSWPSRSSAT